MQTVPLPPALPQTAPLLQQLGGLGVSAVEGVSLLVVEGPNSRQLYHREYHAFDSR